MNHLIKKGHETGIVIYIHGNSSSNNVFKHIISSEKINNTQITVALNGHRGNSNNSKKDLSIEGQSKMILKILKAYDEPILLVGNSLGGHLALEIASEINNLAGLVLFGTPPVKKPINFDEAFLPCPAIGMYFIDHTPSDEVEKSIASIISDSKHINFLKEDFELTDPRVRTALAENIAIDNLKNEHKIFKELDVPKYILVGEEDPSPNPKYLEDLCLESTNCELIKIKNCGHYVSLEQPDEFLRIMLKVIDKVF